MIKSGKTLEPYIHFIRYDRSVLRVGTIEFPRAVLDTVVDELGVIIWENQGSFRILSYYVLRNTQLHCETSQQLEKEYPRTTKPKSLIEITWAHGIPISSDAVMALFLNSRDSGDKLGNTDTAPDPTTKGQPDE